MAQMPLADMRRAVARLAHLRRPKSADLGVVVGVAGRFDVQAFDAVRQQSGKHAGPAGRTPGRAIGANKAHSFTSEPIDVRRLHPWPGAFIPVAAEGAP